MFGFHQVELPNVTRTVFELTGSHYKESKYPNCEKRDKRNQALCQHVNGSENAHGLLSAPLIWQTEKQKSRSTESNNISSDHQIYLYTVKAHQVHLLLPVFNKITRSLVNLIPEAGSL